MMFTLVFYNIVECMVSLSLFKSMYVEVLYPILLHILKPINKDRWVPEVFQGVLYTDNYKHWSSLIKHHTDVIFAVTKMF